VTGRRGPGVEPRLTYGKQDELAASRIAKDDQDLVSMTSLLRIARRSAAKMRTSFVSRVQALTTASVEWRKRLRSFSRNSLIDTAGSVRSEGVTATNCRYEAGDEGDAQPRTHGSPPSRTRTAIME